MVCVGVAVRACGGGGSGSRRGLQRVLRLWRERVASGAEQSLRPVRGDGHSFHDGRRAVDCGDDDEGSGDSGFDSCVHAGALRGGDGGGHTGDGGGQVQHGGGVAGRGEWYCGECDVPGGCGARVRVLPLP